MKGVKEAMSLKRFMLRQQVLKMYRDYLNLEKLLESSTPEATKNLKTEWRTYVRTEFRLRMKEQDEGIIQNLLVIGKRQLSDLDRAMRISSNRN